MRSQGFDKMTKLTRSCEGKDSLLWLHHWEWLLTIPLFQSRWEVTVCNARSTAGEGVSADLCIYKMPVKKLS